MPMRKSRKFLVLVLIAIIACSLAIPTFATPRDQYEETTKQAEEISNQITSALSTIRSLEEKKLELSAEFDDLEQQVNEYQAELDTLDAKLSILEELVDTAETEFSDRMATYFYRVRTLEEYGVTSYWEILFQSSSLDDLLNRIDYIEEIMAYDEDAIGTLEERIAQLQQETDAVRELKENRTRLGNQLRMAQNQLYEDIQAKIEKIESMSILTERKQSELLELKEKSEKLLSRIENSDYQGNMNPVEIYQKCVVETGDINTNPEGAQIVAFALQYLGYEYVWGGASPETGFDCSGLCYYTYAQFGYYIQRVANSEWEENGYEVDVDHLQAGDLLFFHTEEGPVLVTHVGMYVGDGIFLHASNPTRGIIASSIYSDYYMDQFVGAKRIIGEPNDLLADTSTTTERILNNHE